jgi:hypothetical protein
MAIPMDATSGREAKMQKQTHYSASPSNGPERRAKDLEPNRIVLAGTWQIYQTKPKNLRPAYVFAKSSS